MECARACCKESLKGGKLKTVDYKRTGIKQKQTWKTQKRLRKYLKQEQTQKKKKKKLFREEPKCKMKNSKLSAEQ